MNNEQKLKLLIVDDEQDNLDLLYRTFRRNFQVFKAENPLKALEMLENEGEMAIIISDQKMPYMNGTEFLCQTVDKYPDTIRILLTGYTDIDYLVEAINEGKVFKYLTKPWQPQDLKDIVQQATETYQVLKQRTAQIQQNLRQQKLFNDITISIRKSLDYEEMLTKFVEAIYNNWSIQEVCLTIVENEKLSETCQRFSQKQEIKICDQLKPLIEKSFHTANISLDKKENYLNIALPLIFQQKILAILAIYQLNTNNYWQEKDLELLESVAEQASLAMFQAKLYQKLQQQSEKMRHELEVAKQIQYNLLSQTWPQSQKFKLDALCEPAAEIGGDFFEIYTNREDYIWLAVGDVSGKGVPAALLMASAISLLRRELAQETSPETVMRNLNQVMSNDLFSTNCFITLFLGCYNCQEKKLDYCNAGHIYPVIWSQKALKLGLIITPKYLTLRGIPLGILPKWKGESGTINLQKGDILLITSDGITEATVTENSLLNQEGLWELIRSQTDSFCLKKLFTLIRQSTVDIQEDDQTMVSLEILA